MIHCRLLLRADVLVPDGALGSIGDEVEIAVAVPVRELNLSAAAASARIAAGVSISSYDVRPRFGTGVMTATLVATDWYSQPEIP